MYNNNVSCDVETYQDFHKYYANTYIALKEDKLKFKVSYPVGLVSATLGFDEEDDTGGITFSVRSRSKKEDRNLTLKKVFSFADIQEKCMFGRPPDGLFVYNNMLLQCTFQGERVSTRGIDFNRYSLSVLKADSAEFAQGEYIDHFDRFKLATVMWFPKHLSVEDAYAKIIKNPTPRILSPRYALAWPSCYQFPVIVRKTSVIGWMPDNKTAIILPEFYQSCHKYLHIGLHIQDVKEAE